MLDRLPYSREPISRVLPNLGQSLYRILTAFRQVSSHMLAGLIYQEAAISLSSSIYLRHHSSMIADMFLYHPCGWVSLVGQTVIKAI